MNPAKSILLVEDDRLDVMTIRRAFHELGINDPLTVVTDGEAALNYLKENPDSLPTLILLDLNMPRMSGLELLAILKADDCFKAIPVVMLTTSNQEDDIQGAYALSAAGYIVKPVDYQEFVQVMSLVHEYWNANE